MTVEALGVLLILALLGYIVGTVAQGILRIFGFIVLAALAAVAMGVDLTAFDFAELRTRLGGDLSGRSPQLPVEIQPLPNRSTQQSPSSGSIQQLPPGTSPSPSFTSPNQSPFISPTPTSPTPFSRSTSTPSPTSGVTQPSPSRSPQSSPTTGAEGTQRPITAWW